MRYTERGLPILRHTMCVVGTHVYTHVGPNDEPEVGAKCDCGLEEWAGRDAPLCSIPVLPSPEEPT